MLPNNTKSNISEYRARYLGDNKEQPSFPLKMIFKILIGIMKCYENSHQYIKVSEKPLSV